MITVGLKLGEVRGEMSLGFGVRGGGGGGTGRLEGFKSELELDCRKCRSAPKAMLSEKISVVDNALCLDSGDNGCSAP